MADIWGRWSIVAVLVDEKTAKRTVQQREKERIRNRACTGNKLPRTVRCTLRCNEGQTCNAMEEMNGKERMRLCNSIRRWRAHWMSKKEVCLHRRWCPLWLTQDATAPQRWMNCKWRKTASLFALGMTEKKKRVVKNSRLHRSAPSRADSQTDRQDTQGTGRVHSLSEFYAVIFALLGEWRKTNGKKKR